MYDRLKRELSFVEGLMDTNQMAQHTPERKALQRLVGVVDELVESLQQVDARQTQLEEYVEAMDEDLNDLELWVYDEEEDEYIEVTCPECGEEVLIDIEDLEDETIEHLCPKCHTILVTVEDDTDDEEENSVG